MPKPVYEPLNKYIDQERLYRTDGDGAIETLCKLSRALGYKDSFYFGQIKRDVTIGDFLEFLKDNPGCVEAITGWIGEQRNDEWCENLESQLNERDEDDEDEDD